MSKMKVCESRHLDAGQGFFCQFVQLCDGRSGRVPCAFWILKDNNIVYFVVVDQSHEKTKNNASLNTFWLSKDVCGSQHQARSLSWKSGHANKLWFKKSFPTTAGLFFSHTHTHTFGALLLTAAGQCIIMKLTQNKLQCVCVCVCLLKWRNMSPSATVWLMDNNGALWPRGTRKIRLWIYQAILVSRIHSLLVFYLFMGSVDNENIERHQTYPFPSVTVESKLFIVLVTPHPFALASWPTELHGSV